MEQHFETFDHTRPETFESHLERFAFWIFGRSLGNDDQQVKSLFVGTLNRETHDNAKEWMVPPLTILNCTFAQLVQVMRHHLTPRVNKIVLYNSFIHRSQKEGETAAQYLRALKNLVNPLGFGVMEEALVFLQFCNGVRNPDIQSKLIANPTFTTQQALDLATSLESSESSVQVIRNGNGLDDAMHKMNLSRKQQQSRGNKSYQRRKPDQSRSDSSSVLCFRCGSIEHKANVCTHAPFSLKCTTCKERGHVAKVCGIRRQRRQRINHLGSEDEQEVGDASNYSSDSDTNSVISSTSKHGSQPTHNAVRYGNKPAASGSSPYDLFNLLSVEAQEGLHSIKPFTKDICINGKVISFELDTGAGRTVITWEVFEKNFSSSVQLHPSETLLAPWGGSTYLQPIGEFSASVKWQGEELKMPLLVLKSSGPNLCGRDWLIPFYGLPLFRRLFQLNQINKVQPTKTVDLSSAVDKFLLSVPPEYFLLKKLPDLFDIVSVFSAVSGIGTGRFKGEPVHIDPLPGARPKYQRARQVPFALTARYEGAVAKRIESGSWVSVDPVENPVWASATVPVVKKSGEVRLCADYKSTVNPAVPEDVFAPPTLDEVFASLAGAKYFGEIDLEDAYTQVPVDLSTSQLMTVTTPLGLFRPTTLQFGIKVAPAIFQCIIVTLFLGLKGVIAYKDNIYVSGSAVREYLERLASVLVLLGNAGLKVNTSKCNWGSSSIFVLGFRVDAHGVHPTEEKVQALLDAPAPQNKQQLQSLLGLVAFYERFIPKKALLLEPLHRLLDKHTPWSWSEECDLALQNIKAGIAKRQVLIHYSLNLPLVISCDAAEYGIGVVLAHSVSTNSGFEERPIAFASRTLSKTERRYSQLDKEALAIIFSVKKFYRYVCGRAFIIYTDHRPMLGILDAYQPIKDHLSPRLLRWSLFLSSFQYRLLHKPSRELKHADFLGRHPIPSEVEEEYPDPAGIFLLAESASAPVTSKEVATSTAQDAVLSKVMEYTMHGWPVDLPPSFLPYKSKLGAERNGVVSRGAWRTLSLYNRLVQVLVIELVASFAS